MQVINHNLQCHLTQCDLIIRRETGVDSVTKGRAYMHRDYIESAMKGSSQDGRYHHFAAGKPLSREEARGWGYDNLSLSHWINLDVVGKVCDKAFEIIGEYEETWWWGRTWNDLNLIYLLRRVMTRCQEVHMCARNAEFKATWYKNDGLRVFVFTLQEFITEWKDIEEAPTIREYLRFVETYLPELTSK